MDMTSPTRFAKSTQVKGFINEVVFYVTLLGLTKECCLAVLFILVGADQIFQKRELV